MMSSNGTRDDLVRAFGPDNVVTQVIYDAGHLRRRSSTVPRAKSSRRASSVRIHAQHLGSDGELHLAHSGADHCGCQIYAIHNAASGLPIGRFCYAVTSTVGYTVRSVFGVPQ
jgi:hypothetical protein